MAGDLVNPKRCPECPPEVNTGPHVHRTSYGYLIWAPDHGEDFFIEEIRVAERRAGREEAAKAVEGLLATLCMDGTGRHLMETAVRIARGDVDRG